MKDAFRTLLVFAAACFLPALLPAQQGGAGAVSPRDSLEKGCALKGSIVNLEGNPIQGASVWLERLAPADRRFFKTGSKGRFETVYSVKAGAVGTLRVSVKAKMKGFLPAREIIDCGTPETTKTFHVTLLPAEQGPNQLSREGLIAELAPRLKSLGPSDGLSEKSSKAYASGVAGFLEQGQSDWAIEQFTKIAESNSACSRCRVMLALAELDSGDWDGAVQNADEAVTLTKNDPETKNPEALLLKGVMETWQQHLTEAAGFFKGALALSPEDSLAMQEMGRAEVRTRNWAEADAFLSRAIAGGAGPEARVLRAEALLGEHKPDEAAEELTRYLNKRRVKNMPLRVRKIWFGVQYQRRTRAVYSERDTANATGVRSINYLHEEIPWLQGVQLAKSQHKLKPILHAVGKRVAEFFRDFQNTSSLEEIHEERLRRNGKVRENQDEKFHYVCLVPPTAQGPRFLEHRENLVSERGEQYGLSRGFMITSGFASVSLIFHPDFQSESTFRYVGRQEVEGRETYIVAFAQQPMQAQARATFRTGNKSVDTYSQGLAWIDARNYQIVRLRTDLLKPLPEVRLERETTQIDYQQVHFKNVSENFWLPRRVVVTVDWNGRLLRNIHRYSDFRLFDVSVHEKIERLKGTGRLAREDQR
jgi:tetratricopeptide (TPR) repeat protein